MDLILFSPHDISSCGVFASKFILEERMDQTFMKTKKVLPLVCEMALPMVLSMLVNSLYNIIDSFFVAKISADAMTALSLMFPLQNIVGAVSIGFGIGVNAAVAYFNGADRKDLAEQSASLGVILSILHGISLTIIMLLVMPHFLGSFGASEAVLDAGIRYGTIVMFFSLATSVGICYEKLFQSVGLMKVSMFSMMAGCIANILLDPLMIFGIGPFPAMGIEGAALATGIGQMLTLVIYLLVYTSGKLGIRISIDPRKVNWKLSGKLYAVGGPASLNQALPSLLITLLNAILAGFSGDGVLILGIYYKLQTFIFLTVNGIIQGIRPLAGYNYGAGALKRVRAIAKTALGMSMVVVIAGLLFCQLMPDKLMGMFLENKDTIADGSHALRIISLGFIASGFSLTYSGMLEGMGKGMQSLVIMLMRYLVVIVPTAALLSRIMGSADGVWHAFWVAEWLTMAIAFILYHHIRYYPIKDTLS